MHDAVPLAVIRKGSVIVPGAVGCIDGVACGRMVGGRTGEQMRQI
jgi:hypothetical protein